MRVGKTTIRFLVILLLLGLTGPVMPAIGIVVGAGIFVLLMLIAFEFINLRTVRLHLEGQRVVVLSLGEEEDIKFELRSNSPETLQVVLRQTWPKLVMQQDSQEEFELKPGSISTVGFNVCSVARGSEILESAWAAITQWGFLERKIRMEESVELKVLPNMKAVKRLHKQLNQFILRGLGARMSPRLGKGREFDRLREYVRDDDYRDIAWKASAKHDKLIVKEYRLDRAQNVLLCIDSGHRMAAIDTRITKMDHAVNAAILISYLCNRTEDKVGMLSFNSSVTTGLPQGKGTDHITKITEFASAMKAEYLHTDYLALAAHIKRRLRSRSLVLIMTTLPEQDKTREITKAVSMLVPTHLPLVVVLSDPALKAKAELLPADKSELCSMLVAHDIHNSRYEMMQDLRRLGAWVVDTTPGDAGVDSINAYLEIKRRQLI